MAETLLTFQKFHDPILAATIATPEKTHDGFIFGGYIAAICGGLFGLFFGYALSYVRKTLPNGQQVYLFNESERKHGKRILIISILAIGWIIGNIIWKAISKQ